MLTFGPPLDEIVPLHIGMDDWQEYEGDLNRKPAFPLYVSMSERDITEALKGYLPGRIIFTTHSGPDGLFRPDLFDVFCPGDVIACGWNEECYGPEPVPFKPTWRENAAVLREVGESVYAVLTGQWRIETGCTIWLPDERDIARAESVRRCREFIKLSGGRIRDCGCRPAFGVIIDQILLDAYWAQETLGDEHTVLAALLELDALVICFLGWMFWSIFGQGMAAQTQSQASHDPDRKMIQLNEIDPFPHQKVSAWLSKIEAWGGVNFLRGLHNDHDKLMFRGGFNAGVVGELPSEVQRKIRPLVVEEMVGERGSILLGKEPKYKGTRR